MKMSGPGKKQQGYALLCVLVITAIAVSLYAGMNRAAQSGALQTDRNNVFNQTVAAAESASENVLSYISRDFLNQSYDPSMLGGYSTMLPTVDWASQYRFSDGQGNIDKVRVTGSTTTVTTNLDSQFRGLYGLVYTCSIQSKAEPVSSRYEMAATVQQDLQLASIPIFQFAIFYSMDLEINPGAAMIVTGKVHGNADIYTAPPASLKFIDDVAATGKVIFDRHPDDPTGGSKTTPSFDPPYVENVSSLTMPIATNNSPEVVRGILEEPPFGEDANSPAGKHRYYNTCDIIVQTSASGVIVRSGKWNNFDVINPDVNVGKPTASYSFIKTTATFYDGREKKYTVVTDLDVAKFRAWISGAGASLNSSAVSTMGHGLNSLYVQDTRVVSGKVTVVRVAEGQTLPSYGLTVATPRPLYVKGHFNAPNTTPGYANTSATKPASLVGDAITVLSGSWSDSASTTPMNSASDTTVNAAFLAGIVPSGNYFGVRHYSGGVENFPRFLENWGSKSFTYNGSMVVMFPSQFATGYWQQTGVYYQAPSRKWAFDINFLDHRKLPPATPQVRKLIRGQWRQLASQ